MVRMACKFHAVMRSSPFSSSTWCLLRDAALALACAALVPAAVAEKADRYEKLRVEADRQGKIDLANNLVVFDGNVVVTKGTMLIQAARVELRETPGGYHMAVAYGANGKTASFRQKRDGVDETIEGEAERLEYDGRTETVRFVNRASVRRLRGAAVADEITGNLVSYDSLGEVFSVSGGNPTAVDQNGGRVRAVLTPRGAAAAPEESPESPQRPAPQLKLSPDLGERR